MARDEKINAFLGSGTVYQGKLDFQGSVRIDGNFTGEVISQGTLVIGQEANIEGTLKVGQLKVSGRLNGEIVVEEKVVLYRTAVVTGVLHAPVMVMEEGAVLEGDIHMQKSGAANKKNKAAVIGGPVSGGKKD